MEVVAAWLAEHGLSDYAANFDEEGYDDMQLLAELSAEETAELGEAVQMKKGHRIKLAKRLAVVQCGGGKIIPGCQVAVQLSHFTPDSRTDSVAIFLKRQSEITL